MLGDGHKSFPVGNLSRDFGPVKIYNEMIWLLSSIYLDQDVSAMQVPMVNSQTVHLPHQLGKSFEEIGLFPQKLIEIFSL